MAGNSFYPGIGFGLLTLLPLLDKSPYRHYSRRIFALTVMGTVILDIVLLTIIASLPVAPSAQELAASTTLQAIGGLWIPSAVLTLLVSLYIFKRDIYRESTRRSLPIWITVEVRLRCGDDIVISVPHRLSTPKK